MIQAEPFTFKRIEFSVANYGGLKAHGEEIYEYDKILSLLFPEKEWLYQQEDKYQGEWFAVGKDIGGYWFHQGDFGSCSGCDQLQGITSQTDAREFLETMNRITPIGQTKEAAIAYLEAMKQNLWSDANVCIDKIIENLNEKVV